MRKAILIVLLISSIKVNGQTIFEYEREINQRENYNFREIEFENLDDKIKLSGTLITPQTDFDRLIVIVPGSGKDTRYSHPKLTEELLQNNIAVYRFDERGVGQSEGEYSYKVSTLKNDLSFCILHLRSIQDIRNKQIGIIGHSLGGISSISLSADHPDVDFFIQMSTPINAGESFSHRLYKEEVFKKEYRPVAEIKTLIDTFNYVIRTSNNIKAIKKRCAGLARKLNFSTFYSQAYTQPQFIEMIKLDTELLYKTMEKPLLFIIGKEDEAIHVDYAVERLNEFKNKLITVKVLDQMDHYLTYNKGEWSRIEKSEARDIDNRAATEILEWINRK